MNLRLNETDNLIIVFAHKIEFLVLVQFGQAADIFRKISNQPIDAAVLTLKDQGSLAELFLIVRCETLDRCLVLFAGQNREECICNGGFAGAVSTVNEIKAGPKRELFDLGKIANAVENQL